MAKRYVNDSSHVRFHVYRHKTETVNGAAVQTMQDLVPGNLWANSFKDAQLFTDQNQAVEIATQASKMLGGSDGFTYCVGQVFIESNGYSEAIVIGK